MSRELAARLLFLPSDQVQYATYVSWAGDLAADVEAIVAQPGAPGLVDAWSGLPAVTPTVLVAAGHAVAPALALCSASPWSPDRLVVVGCPPPAVPEQDRPAVALTVLLGDDLSAARGAEMVAWHGYTRPGGTLIVMPRPEEALISSGSPVVDYLRRTFPIRVTPPSHYAELGAADVATPPARARG